MADSKYVCHGCDNDCVVYSMGPIPECCLHAFKTAAWQDATVRLPQWVSDGAFIWDKHREVAGTVVDVVGNSCDVELTDGVKITYPAQSFMVQCAPAWPDWVDKGRWVWDYDEERYAEIVEVTPATIHLEYAETCWPVLPKSREYIEVLAPVTIEPLDDVHLRGMVGRIFYFKYGDGKIDYRMVTRVTNGGSDNPSGKFLVRLDCCWYDSADLISWRDPDTGLPCGKLMLPEDVKETKTEESH